MQKYSHLPQLEVGILFSPEICFRRLILICTLYYLDAAGFNFLVLISS